MLHANTPSSARTMIRCLAILILATAELVGCNRAPTSTTAIAVSPSRSIAAVTEYPEFPAYPPVTAPLPPQARYDAALWSASALLNDGKLPEALAALRQVQSVESTPMLADAI